MPSSSRGIKRRRPVSPLPENEQQQEEEEEEEEDSLQSDDVSSCLARHPIFNSKTAKSSNAFLWGDDWEEGKSGVLLRAPDGLDDDVRAMAERDWANQTLKLLPASYLHASIRAPNQLYTPFQWSVGFLIGSKFAFNNRNDHSNRNHRMSHWDSIVNVSVCYPGDAGSLTRLNFETNEKSVLLTDHGGGCKQKQMDDSAYRSCLGGGDNNNNNDNTSFTSCLMDTHCRCNNASLVPDFGAHFSYSVRTNLPAHKRPRSMTFHSCWYETDNTGMKEMIAASNSLWLHRSDWNKEYSSKFYNGWNECPATSNLNAKDAVDAIVIQVPPPKPSDTRSSSPCSPNLNHARQLEHVLHHLKLLHRRYGYVPVLFLGQTPGMPTQDACDKYWNGTDCQNGYGKYFFSQTFDFADGSCIARPPGCDDAFYFSNAADCHVNKTPTLPKGLCQQQQHNSRSDYNAKTTQWLPSGSEELAEARARLRGSEAVMTMATPLMVLSALVSMILVLLVMASKKRRR